MSGCEESRRSDERLLVVAVGIDDTRRSGSILAPLSRDPGQLGSSAEGTAVLSPTGRRSRLRDRGSCRVAGCPASDAEGCIIASNETRPGSWGTTAPAKRQPDGRYIAHGRYKTHLPRQEAPQPARPARVRSAGGTARPPRPPRKEQTIRGTRTINGEKVPFEKFVPASDGDYPLAQDTFMVDLTSSLAWAPLTPARYPAPQPPRRGPPRR